MLDIFSKLAKWYLYSVMLESMLMGQESCDLPVASRHIWWHAQWSQSGENFICRTSLGHGLYWLLRYSLVSDMCRVSKPG